MRYRKPMRKRRKISYKGLKSYIRRKGRRMSRFIKRINHLTRGGIRI